MKTIGALVIVHRATSKGRTVCHINAHVSSDPANGLRGHSVVTPRARRINPLVRTRGGVAYIVC